METIPVTAQLETQRRTIGKGEEAKHRGRHLHPRLAVRSLASDVPKQAIVTFGGLNIHEANGHNSIGYLGGIVDGCLDALEDAERANVTAFIDFTTSKTWLYSSRLKRSAKMRMCCRNIVPICGTVRR